MGLKECKDCDAVIASTIYIPQPKNMVVSRPGDSEHLDLSKIFLIYVKAMKKPQLN